MKYSKWMVALLVLGIGLTVAASNVLAATPIPLNLVRAVRISTTSITLSFITDDATTGRIEYIALDGSDITLSDTSPQTDHLFTLDELDPSRGYSFTLTAFTSSNSSHRYLILLAPQSIGEPGQSIVPPIDILASDGTKLSSSLSTSTSPYDATTPSPWVFIFAALGLLGLAVLRFFLKRSNRLV